MRESDVNTAGGRRINENFREQQVIPRHILLVDGNEKQRLILLNLLKSRLRYHVTEAISSHDAVQALSARGAVELVLFDLSTVKNGMVQLSEIKAAAGEIPIVVLLNYGEYQEAAEALLIGAHDFLTKPVAEERMNVTLRNTIYMRNIMKEAQKARMQGAEGAVLRQPNEETVISLVNSEGDARKIEDIERAAIHFAIRFYNGRMTEVARKLGIGRSTLYRKLGSFEGV